jgi:hypothetical protein
VWVAHGVILSDRGGGALRAGDQFDRDWLFQRQCIAGQCAIYWTRPIDVGVFTARLQINRDALSAKFSNEAAPCEIWDSGAIKSLGLLTSKFSLRHDPRSDQISGTEHTYATTTACSGVDRYVRWTATRIASVPRVSTPAPDNQPA